MTEIKPGNAIRLVAIFAQPPPPTTAPSPPPPSTTLTLPNGEVVTVFGNLYNPPGPLVVMLHDPSGNATNVGAATMSVTGVWYVNALIPLTGWPGSWQHRWYQQGVAVDANFLQERTFRVEPLDF